MKWLSCALAMLLTCSANAYIDKSKIGWDQHVGAKLPLDLEFTDSQGQRVRLGDSFEGRPVALAFVYLSCPELCPEVLTGIQEAFDHADLKANRDYEFIAVSIDPHDTPTDAAARLQHLPLANHHLRLLTTTDHNAAKLAQVAGFRYVYDNEHQQFAHPAGFLVATPDGKISRYFFGVRYDAQDLRDAVEVARGGSISPIVRQILLVCFHFDPTQGPYSATIMTTLRGISIAMLALVAIVLAMRIHHRKHV